MSMDGVILIDKPAGPTSAEVVRQIKRRIKPHRVGHLGTLDPFATGLLPIMVGEATKLAAFIEHGEREYEGVIRLGSETDTLDPTGELVRTAEVPALDRAKLDMVATKFTGRVEQVPPIFSAIKRAGVPLYRMARRGDEVAPPQPRTVEIKELILNAVDRESIRFRAVCSSGTYARALARDIGAALNSAAHLASLRRLRCGAFSIEQARPLDQTLAALESGKVVDLVSLRDVLAEVPELEISAEIERRVRNGDSRALSVAGSLPPGLFKVVRDGRLIAIAQSDSPVAARLARVLLPAPADPDFLAR